MSLFRFSTLRRLASTWAPTRSRPGRPAVRAPHSRKPRRLAMDPLEERVLLTMAPSDVEDILVNRPFNLADYARPYPGAAMHVDQNPDPSYFGQSLPRWVIQAGTPETRQSRSIASDHDGDLVVAYTRYDVIAELSVMPSGAVQRIEGVPIYNPVIDPETGEVMTDANIYARYFTDEVQRLTLPEAAAADTNPNPDTYGTFSLVAGGYEIQKLTFSATYEPFVFDQQTMEFDVLLKFDQDQDGSISPIETAPFHYDENAPLLELVAELTAAVTTISQSPTPLTVEALNAREFLIHFDGPNFVGNQRLMEADMVYGPNSTGFLPSIIVTTEREPVKIGEDASGNPLIPIHPTDGRLTALAIEQWFTQTSRNFPAGPTFFPPPDRVGAASAEGARYYPDAVRTAVPRVTVIPVTNLDGTLSTTQFDITFESEISRNPDPATGLFYASSSGNHDHPPLEVSALEDDFGSPVGPGADVVKTIKEPSLEFRVNPPEPDNPFTIGPDVYDQTDAGVAIDADGEFVVVWESEVPNSVRPGSVSDIYGRRFAPVGVNIAAADVPQFVVPGVRGLPFPEATDVQYISFDDNDAAPLSGPFQLRLEVNGVLRTTSTIQFNSSNLAATAAAIQSALDVITPGGITVTVVGATDPYRFQVVFGGASGGMDWEPIQYVADGASPLAATVTVSDPEEDLLTFRANNFTANAQYDPHVAMDGAGNFVVVWANNGQDISYFNGIVAQQFDRYGTRLGAEFNVNREDTSIHFDPFVAMSFDGVPDGLPDPRTTTTQWPDDRGYFAVTWTQTDDPNYLAGNGYVGRVLVTVHDPNGQLLIDHAASAGTAPRTPVTVAPAGVGNATVDFDLQNNFVISAELATNSANYGNGQNDIHGVMYALYAVNATTGALTVSGNVIRPEFRVNSSSFNLATPSLWPRFQTQAQVAIDADGDIVISYEGYGPDVSENVWEALDPTGVFRAALAQQINSLTNADLLPYFNPLVDSLPDALFRHPRNLPEGDEGYNDGLFSNGDVHGVIEAILINALSDAPAADDEQAGRLRAILESVAGLLYGEANGSMFSRFDAGAQPYDLNLLDSDCVANAQRDGYNMRYVVAIDQAPFNDPESRWSTIELQLVNPSGEVTNVVIPVVYTNNVIDLPATANNIDNALEGIGRSGLNWPEGTPQWEGSVDVRIIDDVEVAARNASDYWDIAEPVEVWDPNGDDSSGTYYYFEVTFQGETHDLFSGLSVVRGDVLRREVQTLTITMLGAPAAGDFTLTIGGVTTGPITFNPANPVGTANAIAAAIDAALGVQGTVVNYIPGTFYDFEIIFGVAGVDQQPITGQPEGAATDVPPPLNAQISTVTDQNGGSFRFDPISVVHTLGDDGLAQELVSLGMEPDGDIALAWTQYEEYTDRVTNGTVLRPQTQVTITPFGMLIPGDFTLTINGTTTGPITFNPADPEATANSMEIQISAALGIPGVDVTFQGISATGGYQFEILIPGLFSPTITGLPEGTPIDIPPALNGMITSADVFLTRATVNNIYARRFNETTDTAGPLATDVLATAQGVAIEDNSTITGPLTHLVVTFDEDMLQADAAALADALAQYETLTLAGLPVPASVMRILDSVTNPNNYELYRGTRKLEGAIVTVHFGMNKAADLAGQIDPVTGQPYQVSPTPSNKWEAVLTIDANGEEPGYVPLGTGIYRVVTLGPQAATTSTSETSGLRDRAGNPLARNGFLPEGQGFGRDFTVILGRPTENTIGSNPPCGGSLAAGGLAAAYADDGDDGSGDDGSGDDGGSGGDAAVEAVIGEGGTILANGNATTTDFINAHTYAETPSAVAVDGDGDYVIVWTALDPTTGQDRAYYQIFDADGTPADLPLFEKDSLGQWVAVLDINGDPVIAVDAAPALPVTPLGTVPQYNEFCGTSNLTFDCDDQRYVSVASDEDGDFVVTWTNFHGVTREQDIFARRFNAMGDIMGVDENCNVILASQCNPGCLALPSPLRPFRVNTYTTNIQKWSDVAMDVDGDFIITWSSLGQEDFNQLGRGWGIYARRFDSLGQPLAPEFQVNVTTAGNQQLSRIAMDAIGRFTITWTSDQNGVGDDIIARSFDENGIPFGFQQGRNFGPLGGEILVNLTTDGNQRYSDISITPDGQSFVITWASMSGQPNNFGYDVYARVLSPPIELVNTYTDVINEPILDADGPPANTPGITTRSIFVPDAITIADLDVRVDLRHPRVSDLQLTLIDPAGNRYPLAVRRPQNPPGTYLPGADYQNTIFDDQALMRIDDLIQARPPFNGTYVPETSLIPLNGTNSLGLWQFEIIDYLNGPAADPFQGLWISWSLTIRGDAAASPEFLVNTTQIGDQTYPAVAVDHQGDFVITWSGRGSQPGQVDQSGFGGVYYQRYDRTATPIGGETRVNITTAGSQWLSSIDTDGEGNFVIAYTGVDPTDPTQTTVFHFASAPFLPVVDDDGPFVTDVLLPNRCRVLQGDVLEVPSPLTGVEELIVVFNEELNQGAGLASVLNPHNWRLERNGAEIAGAVTDVEFERNPYTRKWEATIQLDGNGLGEGDIPLPPGEYVLVVRDFIEDINGNQLDGDFDGIPGTDAASPLATGHPGYPFHFVVSIIPNLGAEYRINKCPGPDQQFSPSVGTGVGREETTRSVAIDNDGDYAVVWTSYGQDDPNDPYGAGVYVRMFNRDNLPLTLTDIQVNVVCAGNQRNATVAMDADGDFVVVWEEDEPSLLPLAPGDVVFRDIWARQFNSLGVPVGLPFRVNTDVANDQSNPAVAMDDFGNFVVAWATAGQPFSYFNDVKAQLYDFNGCPVGEEFRVNSVNIPGTYPPPGIAVPPGSNEVNPAVAMDADGDFIVVWDQVSAQTNGIVLDTNIVGRIFDENGNPLPNFVNGTTDEFQVNVSDAAFLADNTHTPHQAAQGGSTTGITRDARNAQVQMNDRGDFVVVWEGYQDNDLDGAPQFTSYGIYYRAFQFIEFAPADPTQPLYGEPLTVGDQQANLTITTVAGSTGLDPLRNSDIFAGNQVNPSIGVDADGDFTIAWNGQGAEPHPLDPENWRLVADVDGAGVFTREFHAGILLNPPDNVVPGPVTPQTRVNLTQAGVQEFPTVAMEPDGDYIIVWSGRGVGDQHGIFARRYNEPTDTAGPRATELRVDDLLHTRIGNASAVVFSPFVVDPNLPLDQQLEAQIQLQLDAQLADLYNRGQDIFQNPNRLVVVFDEQMSVAGGCQGEHSVENPNNWALTRADGTEVQGAIQSVTFGFNPLSNKWEAVVTFDGTLQNGAYILWVRSAVQDVVGNPLARTGLLQEGTATFPTSPTSNAVLPVPATSPLGGLGLAFRVHDMTPGDPNPGDIDTPVNNNNNRSPEQIAAGFDVVNGNQTQPAIARVHNPLNPLVDGDYVVVWASPRYIQDVNNPTGPLVPAGDNDIMAQRFDAMSRPLGEPFRVNSIVTGEQTDPDVAVDAMGNFIVTWSGAATSLGDDQGIFAQRFNAHGNPVGGQFRINATTYSNQRGAAVAMDADGDFVVAWSSYKQDGDRDGVYVRRFNSSGSARDSADVRASTYTAGWQWTPDVAMDCDGDFVVVWASDGQDGSSFGVYGQRFNAAGVRQGSEFRVHQYTNDKQLDPSVAMDLDGDFVVAWSSFLQDGSGYGVYARRYAASGAAQGNEFRVNQTTDNWQYQPDVAMSDNGDFVIVWSSLGQDDNPGDNDILRDYGIYARMFNADGSDFRLPFATAPVGEFRVNALTNGNQTQPAVARDSFGHYVVVWAGPRTTGMGTSSADTDIFSRLIDPPTEDSSGIGQLNSTTFVLNGTAGNDVFKFIAGPTPDTWYVKLNSIVQRIGSQTTTIIFDGLTEVDRVVLVGTDEEDAVELWRDSGHLRGASYWVLFSAAEIVQVDGMGGLDQAVFYDTVEDDVFTAVPGWASMRSPGITRSVSNVESVTAHATAGIDVAKLYDSAGDDTFEGSPTEAALHGAGFHNESRGFEYVYATALEGGTDTATLHGSAGDDTFTATPTQAILKSAGTYQRARTFESVTALAGAGGNDTARLYDSAGNDDFWATPNDGAMVGKGYSNRATGFQSIIGFASAGNDTARLTDSSYNDQYVATPVQATLWGPGFFSRAKAFDSVHAFSMEGGYDTAELYDSTGDDTLTGSADVAILSGSTFYNRAKMFEKVSAFSSKGVDKAALDNASIGTPVQAQASKAKLAWLYAFDAISNQSIERNDVVRAVDEVLKVFWL